MDDLDCFVRGQIYGYIKARRKANLSLMKKDLSMNEEIIEEHIEELEKQGLVKKEMIV